MVVVAVGPSGGVGYDAGDDDDDDNEVSRGCGGSGDGDSVVLRGAIDDRESSVWIFREARDEMVESTRFEGEV